MNKKSRFSVFFVCTSAVFSFVIYYSSNPCYKPATEQTGLSVVNNIDDTIRIAYIGDSWAYRHKKVNCIIDSIIFNSTGKEVLIRNVGIGGLVSKEIYYSIFNKKEFKDVIEWGPDFCYVSAGINDTNKKSGSSNYAENMRLIITLLLDNGIVPIIQEIPYYDISYAFYHMKYVFMLRSLRSMLWTWSSLNCIDDYTKAFNNMIEENHWQKDVIVIRRDSWNPEGYRGHKNIYTEDRMHLNQNGYFVLDSCIASHIVIYLRDNYSQSF